MTTRRNFLAQAGMGLAGITAMGAAKTVSAQTSAPPNIVLFFVDDSGYGDYSFNGNPTVRTPHIAGLQQAGASFTQFYVTSPACSASRYSLLTGRYPGRSGLGSWVIGPTASQHLRVNEVTLADGLKSKGYATGMFGKWHLGNPNSGNGYTASALPLAHGFDQWIGTNVSHDYDSAKLMKSDPAGNDPIAGYTTLATNLPSDTAACESLTGRYTDAAIEFIQQNKGGPFFAYIAHNMPHLGIYASDAFKGRSRRGLFGDVMEEIDDSVGRVRQALVNAGVADNTLIIFASDNGPWIKYQYTASDPKYGEARLNIGYALPFRDGKGSTWEGGHRVPGIFCWPGKIPANMIVQEPASTLDILPTVFALAGVDLPTDRTIDGRDISSLLQISSKAASYMLVGGMPAGASELEPFRFLYSYSDNQPSALRKGPWKLHVRIGSQTGDNYGFTASHEDPLLFQIEEDLGEKFDRSDEEPATTADLLADFDAMKASIVEDVN